MSDIMRPMPFSTIVEWITAELKSQKSVFGVREAHFFYPGKKRVRTALGDDLSVPLGPAAGPHTQLAQNIIASYLTGARFIELKTVQKMDGDEIREAVAKPCINAEDEAYNCEWSTELTVEEAFNEYVKAWFAIGLLKKELGISEDWDLVYNMSVGYDLAGIKTKKIDDFIEGLKDASETEVFLNCRATLEANMDRFEHFTHDDLYKIPHQLCNAITLSTLHGTKPEEIKSISKYLIEEKGLHTFVKCNPTLLGYEFARKTLDELGYDYMAFDDHHFRHDLQYADAITMFHELIETAKAHDLVFGVKLTNTFPVKVDNKELPAEEMYMSGRALLPLTISLAAKLAEETDGRMPISYSGGADANNVKQMLETGIAPVTVATTLLKPGGYMRFKQMTELAVESASDWRAIDVEAVKNLARQLIEAPENHKRWREKVRSRKTDTPLPLFDCFKAPCKSGGCPIEQQIPEYLKLVADGRADEAFDVIAIDNTAPTILGILCSQQCREHCTRLDYDESLAMRDVKKIAADAAQKEYTEATEVTPLQTDKKVVVIGAGPAGIAAAMYLRRAGIKVDVHEKLDTTYGIVRTVIPEFRIPDADIDRDLNYALATGFEIKTGVDPNYDVDELLKTYDKVIVATGAWGKCVNPVKDGADKVEDALDYLWRTRMENNGKLPAKVAVIGAGDVAMDCARLAKRTEGVEDVTIVYRRNETYMPATQHDVNLTRADGINILELHNPVSFDGKTLKLEVMRLGAYGEDGRKYTEATGEFTEIEVDHVIAATGASLEPEMYDRNGLELDQRGRPVLNEVYESSKPGVYVIGDGRRGPSTIVDAMADAKRVALDIAKAFEVKMEFPRVHVAEKIADIEAKRGRIVHRRFDDREGERCLKCDEVCEICVEVCPNRANISIPVPGMANLRQIIHMDGMCNECGNCATFCPHAGKPYTDKPTIYWNMEDFTHSTNDGLVETPEGFHLRLDGVVTVVTDLSSLPPLWAALMDQVERDGRPFFMEATHADL
ncbi:MAG TPA: putative selenate reductase subunit YgfK [Fastidiosipila sp.]|nr:putative selenate reductase subunit YgfK [Fastidiosipila sp.]